MAKKEIHIQPAFLTTKEKLKDRLLLVGKILHSAEDGSDYMFYLLEILNSPVPVEQIEKEIIAELQNSFQGREIFTLSDFEETLKDLNSKIKALFKEATDLQINALLGIVENHTMHLTAAGSANAYIIRNNKITSLTSDINKSTHRGLDKLFENITSGELVLDDKIVMGNIRFYDIISIARLRQIIGKSDSKQIAKDLHKQIRKTGSKNVASAIITADTKPNNSLPEIYYLDKKEETSWNKLKKRSAPYIKKAKKSLGVLYQGTRKKASTGLKNSKEHYRENFAPKLRQHIAEGTSSLKEAAKRKIKSPKKSETSPIKVTDYSQKTKKVFVKLEKAWQSIKKSVKWLFAKKNRRYLYIVLAVLLVFGGYMKVRSNNINKQEIDQREEYISMVSDAEDKYQQGKQDIKVNLGADKLLEAYELAEKASDAPDVGAKARNLMESIQDELDSFTQTTRIADAEELFAIDHNLVLNELVGTVIYSLTDTGRIYKTDTRNSQSSLIASIGEESGKPVDAAYGDNTDELYIYTDQQKIFSLQLSTETIKEVDLAESSNSWEDATAIATYATNLYLLDSTSGELWKHTHKSTGYNPASAYVDTTKINLQGSSDVAIDGNIYILKNDASVAKFVRGSYDASFKIKNIPNAIGKIASSTKIFTDADSNHIFTLDSLGNRIIRYDKNGTYSGQYVFDLEKNVQDFVVNPRVQKIWVEAEGSFFEIAV